MVVSSFVSDARIERILKVQQTRDVVVLFSQDFYLCLPQLELRVLRDRVAHAVQLCCPNLDVEDDPRVGALDDIGRTYGDYVELMAHFDEVLPGRVHRVFYERLVDDAETEIQRLLDYCGLPFEEGCLRFHETDRAVRSASSQQVRQPINRAGVDHWRHFEDWLGPLKQALGPVLDAYPAVPRFDAAPRD